MHQIIEKKSELKVATIAGDGVGPEVTREARRVLEKGAKLASLKLLFEDFSYSADEYLRTKRSLTTSDLQRFQNEFDAILFGALGDPRIPDNAHAKEILLGLRFQLDLFVNFRPVRLLHPKICPLKNKSEKEIHFVLFRENTEGLYRNLGGQFKRETSDEVALETMINTRKGVARIIEAACTYAEVKNLRRVCMVDKSNALTYGHDLWQRVWKEVQKKYSKLQFKHLYVDTAAMELVRAPEQFDVIVTENLFGDILSDLGAQLQGGMGLAASVNYRPGVAALFEPVHGTAPTLAGKNSVNPLASILTAALFFEYFGYPEISKKIEGLVRDSIEKNIVTQDLGGSATTKEVGDYICQGLS